MSSKESQTFSARNVPQTIRNSKYYIPGTDSSMEPKGPTEKN